MRKIISTFTSNWRGCIFLLVVLFAVPSCSYEESNLNNREEGTEKEITIHIAIPGTTKQSALRSMGETEENTISSMDVLAFYVDNDGREYYDYYVKTQKATDNTEGASSQTFTLTARTKTAPQRFVVIANTGTKIKKMIDSGNWKGMEKNEMLSGLEFSLATAGEKWNTSGNYTALPMWGESGQVTITAATNRLTNPVSLLRMVARIDVRLDQTIPDLNGKFKLKSVWLYNSNTKGKIVPGSNVLATENGSGKLYVKAPTLPADAQPYRGPLEYRDFSSPGVPDRAMLGAIYTFETAKPVDDDRLKVTGLVIGGLYETDTEETYYRVDFLNSDKSFRDILRNFVYTVNIVGVKGRGHGHPDEAWEGKNVSMDVDVLEWSDSGLDNVEIKGQYFLQVNKNRFDFSREACTTIQATNVLLLTTNYRAASSSGWRIDHITDENDISPVDWLTVTAPNGSKNAGAYGPPDTEAQLVLTYTQNTTGQPRYAKIVFAAGRLRYTVNVVQDIREGVSITFYSGSGKIVDGVLVPDGHVIDTLKFHYPTSPYVNQEAQSFTITWTPKEADVRLFETHKYVQPINGISRFLNINTNPPNFRVITSHSGVFVLSVGLEYLHTEENRQAMYYAQSAIGFYVSNGVEEIEKYIVFVCYPPN